MARPKTSVPAGSMTERFNLMRFTDSLIVDLEQLRAGQISIREARSRAELARQVLRSVHYVISAQRFIEGQAKHLPQSGTIPDPTP